jgi:hypothetical protein
MSGVRWYRLFRSFGASIKHESCDASKSTKDNKAQKEEFDNICQIKIPARTTPKKETIKAKT